MSGVNLRPDYLVSLEHRLLGVIDRFHLVQGHANREALLIALAIGSIALFAGLLLSTQLIAASGTGAAAGIELAIAALALGADALRFQLAPLAAWQQALLALIAALVLIRISRDLLDASWPRTAGALLGAGFFGGLIAVLLGLAVQMANAI
jgi:hypothetical protein